VTSSEVHYQRDSTKIIVASHAHLLAYNGDEKANLGSTM
jgi:hypothetical protein